MKGQKKIKDIDSLNQTVFPMVYGKGSKSNSLAQDIFELFIDYTNNKDQCILEKEKERTHIFNLLTKAAPLSELASKSLHIIFMCEYGCAIKLSKNKEHSPINVQIISLEKWATGAHASDAKSLELVNPQGHSSLFAQSLNIHSKPLQSFAAEFEGDLSQAFLNIQQTKVKKNQNYTVQLTTQELEEACKTTLKDMQKKHEKNTQKNEKKEKKVKKSEEENGEQVEQSFQVAKTFGKNISLKESQADTAWYVTKAVIMNLIGVEKQQKYRTDKLIIGFRGWILKQATEPKPDQEYNRKQIELFKLCLDEIITEYKERVSRYTKKIQKFITLTTQIEKSILSRKGGKLTSKIEDKPSFYGKLDLTAKEKPLMIPQKEERHKKIEIKQKTIDEYNIQVNRRYLFQQLLELYQLSHKDKDSSSLSKWILLTEKSLFNLTQQLCNDKQAIDLSIHMRQIQCEMGASTMGKVLIKYEKQMRKRMEYYGLQLEGQSVSHIQLARAIIAIVAFESVNFNREKRGSNLFKFRVPIDIMELYDNFHSNSLEARRAMRQLKVYHQYRQNKKKIFELNENSTSFYAFGREVAKETRSALVWIETMKRWLQAEKQIRVCKLKISQYNYNSNLLQGYEEVSRNQLKNLLGNNNAFAIQSPCEHFAAKDPYLFAFINNIPPDVLGMIKMCFYAQNPVLQATYDNQPNLTFINSLFGKDGKAEEFPINIYARKQSATQTLSSQATRQNIASVVPANRVYILYDRSITGAGYKEIKFYKQIENFGIEKYGNNKQMEQMIKLFLAPPNNMSMKREHEVYASLPIKPDEIELENFLAMGNVRAAEHTQLTILCSNILQRKIISNSYDHGCMLAERLILQTGGRLSIYNIETQQYFGRIQKLVKQFINVWGFTDTTFCPIIAPLLSFLAREIIEDGLVADQDTEQLTNVYFKLSSKCWQQFKRAEKEQKQNPEVKINWDQRFVCMAAICCYREIELDIEDSQQISFLLQLIFQLRVSKILSEREQRPPSKRKFENQLEFYVEKAIFRNIGTISNYVNIHHDKLSAIVKKLDNSFPADVEWERINTFHFRGVSKEYQDIYQLNIYCGFIYKNGKEISCLDAKIKANKYYKEIFGKDREFQVFPSHYPNYLRTKDNFNYQFKINEAKQKVYFEFSEDGKEIRHVVKQEGKKLDEDVWTLIPRDQLKKAQCHIPKIYSENHLAWYSHRRKCIAFRKPTFDKIFEIGMVIFLAPTEPQPTIVGASHITYHGTYDDQVLDDICNPTNPRYEEIILRNKNQTLKSLKPFEALSRFEPVEFILQLKNRTTQDTYYWLHRYQLKFKVVDGSRLLSQTFFGYALDYSYQKMKNSLFNRFPCLVLEKYIHSPTLSSNHTRIMLVSDGRIQYDGMIIKNDEALHHWNFYKYDIHDFFGDIRGQNRQALLHLACIMLSINDNITIESIEMTPLQYAMYLMKSCFTNRPLSQVQDTKLENIFELANTEVLLLGEALNKMANSLVSILPFSPTTIKITTEILNKDNQEQEQAKQLLQRLLMCRTLYENSHNNDTLKYRQKINKDILTFLGVQLHQKESKDIDRQDSSSEQFEHNKQYWKGYQAYTGESLIEDFTLIQNDYKMFQQETLKLNIWSSTASKNKDAQFPEEIKQLVKKHPKDEMMKEMIGDLENSFKVYCDQNDRISEIASKITKEERENQLQLIKNLQNVAKKIIHRIDENIKNIKKDNQPHPDIITGIRPTLSPAMYTSILCEKDLIMDYYPHLCKSAAKLLINIMKIWLELKTRTSSFQRIQNLLKQEKVDVTAVMRQVLSPREAVFKKNEWLCFEAQMKVQLWPSQLETYNNLMSDKKSGSFCQLNMGEGKTQVIIPLMILDTIYSRQNQEIRLPRINLLSSLFEQARSNFFRFISATGFQIPAFELPFNRKVALTNNEIKSVQHLIDSFSSKAYILMTRESRLSEILRFQEGKIMSKTKHNRRKEFDLSFEDCQKPLIQNNLFEIYDEIDALMTCKKSYIFSIGNQIDLAHYMMRFEILRLCLDVFLIHYFEECLKEKIAVTDETDEEALEMVSKGDFPIGLRLIIENMSKERILKLRRDIAETILFKSKKHQYSFVNSFKSKQEKENLLDYIVHPEKDSKIGIPAVVPDASKPQIYLLRGILAHGVFEHSLEMRCGVDYGAPNSYHFKRIAVPYEAADIPSKTSEYEQPDMSIFLSYIAYFTKGLSEPYFDECLKALLELSKTSKENEYKAWLSIMDDKTRQSLQMKTVDKINYNSKAHRDYMYKVFRKNRRTVSFWFIKCVFEKDLRQYSKSICSSAWDLADSEQRVGFSGTKDNRWLYSNSLKWKPCQTPEIKGTDGKMIHLITNFTKEVALIEENNKTLWQRFVDLALDKKVGCIIDAGAICVGKSLRDEIVPWIAEHEKFDTEKYVGISFCDSNGQWFVYDIQGKFYIPRGTTIPDHQTFVVFDQARTRGADLKLNADIVAALSLGPELTKDSLVQAAGRLRLFGRNQTLIIMATQEVFSHLPKFPKDSKDYKKYIQEMNASDKEKLPKQLIAWCCQNSIKENQDLLMQFAELGWKYIHSKVNRRAFEQKLTTDLEKMYSEPLLSSTVSDLGRKAAQSRGELANHPSGKFICQILEKYGKAVIKQVGTLDDVCEREVQAEKQQQNEKENEFKSVAAIPETEQALLLDKIIEHPFCFDPKFKMSANLMITTQPVNEIPQVYFVKVSKNDIVGMSIRQVSNFIEKTVINYVEDPYEIYLLSALTLDTDIIQQNKLEGALVSAKFLSGLENYTTEEEEHLLPLLINSCKERKQWSDDYNLVVSLFLRLKRVYLKKFRGSTLESLMARMHNKA